MFVVDIIMDFVKGAIHVFIVNSQDTSEKSVLILFIAVEGLLSLALELLDQVVVKWIECLLQ